MKMPTTKKHIIERIIENTKKKHYQWELVEDSVEIRKYQVNPNSKFNNLVISLYKNTKNQRLELPNGWFIRVECTRYALPLLVEFELNFSNKEDLSLFTEIGLNIDGDEVDHLYHTIYSAMDEAFMFI